MMIPNWLLQRAKLTPDASALVTTERSFTYRELYEDAQKIAEQLHQLGVEPGSRMALLAHSTGQTVCFIHACWLLGVEVVCLNNRLTEDELVWQLNDSQSSVLLVDDRIASPPRTTGVSMMYSDVRSAA